MELSAAEKIRIKPTMHKKMAKQLSPNDTNPHYNIKTTKLVFINEDYHLYLPGLLEGS